MEARTITIGGATTTERRPDWCDCPQCGREGSALVMFEEGTAIGARVLQCVDCGEVAREPTSQIPADIIGREWREGDEE